MVDQSQNEVIADLPLPDITSEEVNRELMKLRYEVQLRALSNYKAAITAHNQAMLIEQDKAAHAHIFACDQATHNAYLDVAKKMSDHIQTRAEFIEKAAGTLAATYGVLLGLAFSVSKGNMLPARGVIPAFFFGLSIVLAAIYVAYITHPHGSISCQSQPTPLLQLFENLNTFIKWTSEIANRRSYFLHSAIISLGFGIVFFPVAFLSLPDISVWLAAIVCIGIIFFAPYTISQLPCLLQWIKTTFKLPGKVFNSFSRNT